MIYNDYNFFESYQTKRKKKNPSVVISTIILGVTVLAVGGVIGYLTYDNDHIKSEIEKTNNEIETLTVHDDMERVSRKQELLRILEDIVSNMDDAESAILNASIIDENLLLSIVDCIPVDVQLSSFSISGNSIGLSGIADSKPGIAELEYNLKNLDRTVSVFVPGIDRSEVGFSFSMNIVMGGGEQ